MKYRIGDKIWLKGRDTAIKTSLWEIVSLHPTDEFLVEIREVGTQYQPSWIDVSLIQKATPTKT